MTCPGDKNLNILTMNYEFPPVGGGAAPMSLQLCKHLAARGHNIDVITMAYKDLPRGETMHGFKVHRVPAIRKRPDICHTHEMATYLPSAVQKALALTAQKPCDIIHAHFIIPTAPAAWLVGKIRKVPLVVTCHGSDVPGYNPDRFTAIHKLITPAWKFLARHNQGLISPSESLKNLIVSHLPGANVEVIPNGIEIALAPADHKQNRILMCSRLLPRKGFQHVLAAIHDLDIPWTATVIGDGPHRGELEQIARDSKVPVEFTGWLDKSDPRFIELFETSSIFAFTSNAENFPTVLLEAMAAGLAIISSDAGGCTEVTGPAALVTKPGDINRIREHILTLVNNPDLRNDLSNQARQRVQSFLWPAIAERYELLFCDVIRKCKQ